MFKVLLTFIKGGNERTLCRAQAIPFVHKLLIGVIQTSTVDLDIQLADVSQKGIVDYE